MDLEQIQTAKSKINELQKTLIMNKTDAEKFFQMLKMLNIFPYIVCFEEEPLN